MKKLLLLLFFVTCTHLRAIEIPRIELGSVSIGLDLVADGLHSPVDMVHAGDDRLFILDQVGRIRVVVDGTLQAEPFLDIRKRMVTFYPGFDERGLLGLAFHPNYGKAGEAGAGLFYTYSSENEDPAIKATFPNPKDPRATKKQTRGRHQSVIAEWKVDAANPNKAEPASRREVMRIDQPTWNHNGGSMVFDAEGNLYVGFGDGGLGNDTGPGHSENGNGQDLSRVLGKIIRVNPLKSGDKTYSIPKDNPFVGKDGLDEIYAYGFRNLWRLSYDRPTKRLFVADVGQDRVEEVNLVTRGGNFGWRVKEGKWFFDPANPKELAESREGAPANLIDPLFLYGHEDGVSIAGGHIYRGNAIPELKGKYVFGEWKYKGVRDEGYQAGSVDGIFYGDTETGKMQKLKLVGTGAIKAKFIVAFGQGSDGELYVSISNVPSPSFPTGKVYRLVPAK